LIEAVTLLQVNRKSRDGRLKPFSIQSHFPTSEKRKESVKLELCGLCVFARTAFMGMAEDLSRKGAETAKKNMFCVQPHLDLDGKGQPGPQLQTPNSTPDSFP
jgi:hypothetical protein